jgi:hypothetical protein
MGSKRLSESVAEVCERIFRGEVINKRVIARENIPDLDDESKVAMLETAYIIAIDQHVRSRTVATSIMTAASGQIELPFLLPAAVAMDLDGRVMLATRNLSRDQFVRAIEIREQQIVADQAKVREWKNALKAADKFWRKHPQWTFGRCLDAVVGRAVAEEMGIV